MYRISVARLYEDNRDKLTLAWIAGKAGGEAELRRDSAEAASLIGHLNLLHPNRVQVFGAHESRYLDSLNDAARRKLLAELFSARPAAILFTEGVQAEARLLEHAEREGITVLASPLLGAQAIDHLRQYLAKVLADSVERHGVFMDVLGLGVLITGDSGAGKSELGLELISRGHGLVADDVVEISRVGSTTLEGRCPPMLKDFLEVRGLGVLNIRTIFGETAVRPKMNLRLVVQLQRSAQAGSESERLPLHEQSEDILGVTVRKMIIPVAAGRNLAVLIEAAVRNHILQLRGIHSTAEFLERQQAEMKRESGGKSDR